MPTDLIIPPEHHPHFRRVANRLVATGVVFYLLCLLLIPFRLPFWAIYIIMFLAMTSLGTCTMIPWGWWRSFGWVRGRRIVLPYPLSHRYLTAGGVAGIMCIAPLWALGPSPSISLFIALPFLAFGAYLVFLAFKGRELIPPACPKCRYDATALVFPTPCPECGHPMLSLADASVVGHVRRPKLAWIGAASILLGIIAVKAIPLQRSHMVALLPQPWRVAFASHDRDAFATLDTGTLTGAQHARLVDAILDRRRTAESFRLGTQIDWVAALLADGMLTPEQAERFVNEGARPELRTLAEAAVGRPLPMIYLVETPRIGYRPISRRYFIRSLTLADQPLLHHDTTLHSPNHVFKPISGFWLFGAGSIQFPPPTPFHTATPTTPGPATARIETILITVPSGVAPTITWHADGSYTITPEPLTLHEHTTETPLTIAP